jgi:tetratricopeptide (TPR) repeat protein
MTEQPNLSISCADAPSRRALAGLTALALSALPFGLTTGCATRAPVAEEPTPAPAMAAREPAPQVELRVKPNDAETTRLDAAREATAKDDYETALRVFRELLQENPTLADAYTGMGAVHEKRGDLELAEPAYARAVALDPGDFTAVSSHGRVLEALGRMRDAVLAYQRALVIRPRDLGSNLAMSRLMTLTEQPESAVVFAERAVKIDPQNGDARLQFARALSKAGRGADAIREYETACELIEPPSEVMFALVNAYAAEKRYREAANAAEALTRTTPSAAAFERLGWSLFRLNEFDKSDAAYRRAIELDGTYWPALNGVGVNALNAWLQGGKVDKDPRRDEARAMLQRSLRANPDQPKVAALLLKYRL